MKVVHHLEPMLHIKEKSDDIRTYECIQVNLLFMLKPTTSFTQEEFVEMVKRMMKAACDVIEQNNKEADLAIPHPPQQE
jgi:hypothetical protein